MHIEKSVPMHSTWKTAIVASHITDNKYSRTKLGQCGTCLLSTIVSHACTWTPIGQAVQALAWQLSVHCRQSGQQSLLIRVLVTVT